MSLDLMKAELVETDPRFASGPWTGYWTQPPIRDKGQMEMLLTFRAAQITGCGRDLVGNFIFKGRYELGDGKCHWVKSYLGKHDVFYVGAVRGKGIAGLWTIEIAGLKQMGRFVIWPEGEEDPTLLRLLEQAEMPLENTIDETPGFNAPVAPEEEPVGVGVGPELPYGTEPPE